MTYSINKPKTAMILAAGFGKRLLPITEHTPKPLVEINGTKMIDRVIDQVKKCGITDFIVNTHHLAEKIKQHLAARKDVTIKISHEDDILETGGGILKVIKEHNPNPLLVVNADNFLSDESNAIEQVINEWDDLKMDFLVGLKNKNEALTYSGNGDYGISADGRIINENKEYIFTGVYILKPEFFAGWELGKFRVPDVIKKQLLNEEHKLYGTIIKGEWFDIGTHEYLETVRNLMKK